MIFSGPLKNSLELIEISRSPVDKASFYDNNGFKTSCFLNILEDLEDNSE